MKWATRKNMKIDRMACVWLICKYIDTNPEFIFVEESEIAALTKQGVNTFDAEDSKFKHAEDTEGGKYGEKCTFQTMIDAYNLIDKDPVLKQMGQILFAADIGHRLGVFEPREGFGLWALAKGFSITIPNDEEKFRIALPLFDALYAYCEDMEKDD
jgi:hypothetical protein